MTEPPTLQKTFVPDAEKKEKVLFQIINNDRVGPQSSSADRQTDRQTNRHINLRTYIHRNTQEFKMMEPPTLQKS